MRTTGRDRLRDGRAVGPSGAPSIAELQVSISRMEDALADILLLLSRSFQQQEIMLNVIRDGNRALRLLSQPPRAPLAAERGTPARR